MKKTILLSLLAFIYISNFAFAQKQSGNTSQVYKSDLKVLYISDDVNIHFRSPEAIQFVDLSTDKLVGDLPTENVLRIKIIDEKKEDVIINDSLVRTEVNPQNYFDNQEIGIATVVGQSFMAQYKIVYRFPRYSSTILTNIAISPNDMQPLEFPKYEFSDTELKNFSLDIIKQKENKRPIRKEKDLGLTSQLNAIYTMGDLIFLDITFKNKTNLSYDIDQLKFSIDDKKIYKSTNVQSIDIEPLYQLYGHGRFRKNFRNIYVFNKFTYPNNKVLNIRLIENQISGRTINLEIKYSDILEADTF